MRAASEIVRKMMERPLDSDYAGLNEQSTETNSAGAAQDNMTIIPLDAVFRSTDEGSRFQPVSLAHMDFNVHASLADLMLSFGDTWYARLVSDEYFRSQAVAIWPQAQVNEVEEVENSQDKFMLKNYLWDDLKLPREQQKFWRHWQIVDLLNVWTAFPKSKSGYVENAPLIMMEKGSFNINEEVLSYTARRA